MSSRHPELDSGSIHRGSSPKCHCEERSDEAIQETKFSIDKMNTKTERLTFRLPRFARNDKGEKRAAFTLAEVLITLAIIGVVAAMTIPTLINNYQEKVTVTKVKKFYSTFSNAYQLALVEHGPISQWGLVRMDYQYDENDEVIGVNQDGFEARERVINNLMPYMKTMKYVPLTSHSIDQEQGWFFPDGTSIRWIWILLASYATGDLYFTTDGKPLQYEKDGTWLFNENAFKFYFKDNKVFPAGYNNEDFKEKCLTGKDTTACTGWIIKFGNMEYKRCNDLDMITKTKCD